MKQPEKWKIVENVALAIEEAYCAFQRNVQIERDAHVPSVSDPSSTSADW
jgi:hypothetical protein